MLVTCRDERQPVELLERFKDEGLECKALPAWPVVPRRQALFIG